MSLDTDRVRPGPPDWGPLRIPQSGMEEPSFPTGKGEEKRTVGLYILTPTLPSHRNRKIQVVSGSDRRVSARTRQRSLCPGRHSGRVPNEERVSRTNKWVKSINIQDVGVGRVSKEGSGRERQTPGRAHAPHPHASASPFSKYDPSSGTQGRFETTGTLVSVQGSRRTRSQMTPYSFSSPNQSPRVPQEVLILLLPRPGLFLFVCEE